ncbi:MAG: GNAT family N-acetyltransferase [Ferruginibacter sp.]
MSSNNVNTLVDGSFLTLHHYLLFCSMKNTVSPDIINTWLKGWCLSRELPLPVKYRSGFKVDVGYEKQKARYVFSELNDDFIQLSKLIDEPWIFLKVCAPPNEVEGIMNGKWTMDRQRFMMTCFHPMNIVDMDMHNHYKFEYEHYNSTFVVKIVTPEGEIASMGRVILVDDLAIYDQVSTDSKHKRKGLASILMKELERIALSKNISKNILVATEEGRLLYQSLGWDLYSPYTSIFIPA